MNNTMLLYFRASHILPRQQLLSASGRICFLFSFNVIFGRVSGRLGASSNSIINNYYNSNPRNHIEGYFPVWSVAMLKTRNNWWYAFGQSREPTNFPFTVWTKKKIDCLFTVFPEWDSLTKNSQIEQTSDFLLRVCRQINQKCTYDVQDAAVDALLPGRCNNLILCYRLFASPSIAQCSVRTNSALAFAFRLHVIISENT